jgi:hypothetical protein
VLTNGGEEDDEGQVGITRDDQSRVASLDVRTTVKEMKRAQTS